MTTTHNHAPNATGTTPNNLYAQDTESNPNNRPNKSHRGAIIGITAAAAAGLVGGVVGLSALASNGEANPSSAPRDPTETGTSQTISPEIAALQQEFDANREAILADIKKRFQDDNWDLNNFKIYTDGNGNDRSIEPASRAMSIQAMVDRNAAKNTFLTEMSDRQQAKADVGLIDQPGTSAASNMEYTIDNTTPGKPSADEEDVISYKEFTNGSLYDSYGNLIVAAHNTPTRAVAEQSSRARTSAVFTYQWQTTPDGKNGEWRVVSVAQKGQPGWRDDYMNLQDTPIVNGNN